MAYTATRTQLGGVGNYRVVSIALTADAATQTVETGLKNVIGHFIGQQSCSTAGIKCYANSNASGVQSFGVIGISGCVSGDQFFVTVFGI